MNAIALLKADHRTVEELFDRLDELDGGPGKKAIVDKIVRELSIHAAIEEQIFYPEVKRDVGDAFDFVLEALEEHNVVKWELDSLMRMKEDDERFDAKVKVLRDSVMRHVEMEENEMFPRVRDALDIAKLNELGTRLERAKKTAPTRPHPRAPQEPPGNVVVGMAAGVVDRARDAARRRGERGEETRRGKGERRPSVRRAAASKRRATPKRRSAAKSSRSTRAHAR